MSEQRSGCPQLPSNTRFNR